MSDIPQQKLNFVVTGELRSGTAVIQSTLDALVDVACYGNLLNVVPEIAEEEHSIHFGKTAKTHGVIDYYWHKITNPYQYLDAVFHRTKTLEKAAIGVRVTYDVVSSMQLYDLFRQRTNAGDFCLIHVVRNPIACFVSLKQAQVSGVCFQSTTQLVDSPIPPAVIIDVEELVEFVRTWVSTYAKVKASCVAPDSYLEIPYRDVVLNFQSTMHRVTRFLERPDRVLPIRPATRRLRNRTLRKRIQSFALLRLSLPNDVKEFLDFETWE